MVLNILGRKSVVFMALQSRKDWGERRRDWDFILLAAARQGFPVQNTSSPLLSICDGHITSEVSVRMWTQNTLRTWSDPGPLLLLRNSGDWPDYHLLCKTTTDTIIQLYYIILPIYHHSNDLQTMRLFSSVYLSDLLIWTVPAITVNLPQKMSTFYCLAGLQSWQERERERGREENRVSENDQWILEYCWRLIQ